MKRTKEQTTINNSQKKQKVKTEKTESEKQSIDETDVGYDIAREKISGCKEVYLSNISKHEQPNIKGSHRYPLLAPGVFKDINKKEMDVQSIKGPNVKLVDGLQSSQDNPNKDISLRGIWDEMINSAFIHERFEALENHKLKAVQDHYLLNKPLSLPEASKLICANRVDTDFKNELASRVQHKQVIGVGSAKPPDKSCTTGSSTEYQTPVVKMDNCGKAIQVIQPSREQCAQTADTPGPSTSNRTCKTMNPTIPVYKLEGINSNTVVKIAPAQEHLGHTNNDHTNGSEKSKVGTPVLNVTQRENKKPMFYIITNGPNNKTTSSAKQTEILIPNRKVTDKPDVIQTRTGYSAGKYQSVSPVSSQSYMMNGLIVASPKPITQEIYKQLQTNVNIVRSLKAPVSSLSRNDTTKSGLTNVVKSNRILPHENENNNRTQLKPKVVYNSKLTVAQLLKYKRSEEQLEILLKSKLNKSSNASTDNNASSKEQLNALTKTFIHMKGQPSEIKKKGNSSKSDNKDKNALFSNPNTQIQSPDHNYPHQLSTSTGPVKEPSAKDNNGSKKEHNGESSKVIQSSIHSDHTRASTSVGGDTLQKCENMQQEHKLGSFSVKVGGKMVIMRKQFIGTSPEPSTISRKKLPAPKTKKHCETSVKNDALKILKKKLSKKMSTPKDVLVQKLKLVRKSKLAKKLKTAKVQSSQQYSPTKQYNCNYEANHSKAVSTTTDDGGLPHTTTQKCDQDTLSAVLQIWKAGDGTFQHQAGCTRLKNVSHDKNMFRRWYEFSDYPCVIHYSAKGKITQIEVENIKPGFYLLTRTDNAQTDGIPEYEHMLTATLSIYPADLSLMPKRSRAIAIGSFIDRKGARDISIFHNTDDALIAKLMTALLQATPNSNYATRTGRYASVIDKSMSPRMVAPAFYSRPMQDYFSNCNTGDSCKANNSDKERDQSSEKQRCKTKSLTRLPSCSSKAAALKKRQNELLKSCQKITKARRLNCTDTIATSAGRPSKINSTAPAVNDEDVYTIQDTFDYEIEIVNDELDIDVDSSATNVICTVSSSASGVSSASGLTSKSSEEDLDVV